ncbi:MAG TPA: cupin domain-containing protein [Candidatus Paceibacterota bacterium]|nr:cupin domain-containing protein [Candidatus Paceibacterota bacterium]
MNTEELKKKLTGEGFVHIYEWEDAPGTEYPAHAHQGAVSMYILAGGLTFSFLDAEITLTTGDRFDVPIGKEHTAKVGPEGCTFLVGEMIEGDS